MRSIYISLLFLFVGQIISAQNILVRTVKSDISILGANKIADKFIAACDGDYSNLMVDLDLTLLQEEGMEALQSKTVVSADMTIKVYSLISEQLLDTKSIKLVSTGSTANKAKKGLLSVIIRKRKAINKELNKINAENPIKDCAEVTRAIENYLIRQAYTEAFSLSNLSGTDCQESLEDAKIKVYNTYQNQYCQDHLLKAEAFLANRQFDNAVNEIMKISPESNCKDGVKKLVTELSLKKDQAYSDSFQAYVKYLDMVRLERKDRLGVIRLLEIKHLIND